MIYNPDMGNRAPIVAGEWYHCYNRGVDKRRVFESESDCGRFLALLYACNNSESDTRLHELRHRELTFVELLDRYKESRVPLVDIAAYALMSNHVHFIVRPITDDGLSKFMQKVFTGYTMYFNQKFERSGPLFAGVYKSRHITTDEYFKHAIQYVLLNPVEITQPRWKFGEGNLPRIENFMRRYRYASTQDFFDIDRPEKSIVKDIRKEYFDRRPSLRAMLADARAYHAEHHAFLDR